jgi:hypothetical protein
VTGLVGLLAIVPPCPSDRAIADRPSAIARGRSRRHPGFGACGMLGVMTPLAPRQERFVRLYFEHGGGSGPQDDIVAHAGAAAIS